MPPITIPQFGEGTINVAILIPSRDRPSKQFVLSLQKLERFVWGNPAAPDGRLIATSPIWMEDTLLPRGRQGLLQAAFDSQAEYALWLDDDMVFPPLTLHKLLDDKKDIVGVNYSTKAFPVRTTSLDHFNQPIYTREDQPGLVEAKHVGFGILLMRLEAIRKLPLPWFAMDWDSERKSIRGEDVFFFKRLAKELPEVKVFVDQELSWYIGHEGKLLYTHAMIPAPPPLVIRP